MASDAWVVQTSTGSRAGPGSTDGPAIPTQNAFQTNHPIDGFIFQNPVVTGFEDENMCCQIPSFETFLKLKR